MGKKSSPQTPLRKTFTNDWHNSFPMLPRVHDLENDWDAILEGVSQPIVQKQCQTKRGMTRHASLSRLNTDAGMSETDSLCPDEELSYDAEGHEQRMETLDAQLAVCNAQIARLKELLRREDEICALKIDRFEQREQDAQQQIADLKAASVAAAETASHMENEYSSLQDRLKSNLIQIQELRGEGVVLSNNLRQKEEELDRLHLTTMELEAEGERKLLAYEELCNSPCFDKSIMLHEEFEEVVEEYENTREMLDQLEGRNLLVTEQRLTLQKAMETMLAEIDRSEFVSAELAKNCNQVALVC